MKINGLLMFFSGLSAIQGLENFQIDLIFEFDGVNDVNEICQKNSIWYNKSTAESYVQRFLPAIFSNSAASVSVDNVAYQTEPGSWDINCANTSVSNVTNVAVLRLNLTTSISSGKGDVISRLNNFWHGGWNFSVLSSIIGNKSHWIACGRAKDTESTTIEPGRLHPLDCDNPTFNPTLSTNPNQSTSPSTATHVYSTPTGLSTGTHGSSTQHTSLYNDTLSTLSYGIPNGDSLSTGTHGSSTQHTSLYNDTLSTLSYVIPSGDSLSTSVHTSSKPGSSDTVDYGSKSQNFSSTSGNTSWKQTSSNTKYQSSQSQDSSGGPTYSSLKQEQQKKDDPSNTLAVGLGTGLGILALLVTLTILLYRYISEKNKVSDFSGIYGFPPETPRQSDRTGKSTFRSNMA